MRKRPLEQHRLQISVISSVRMRCDWDVSVWFPICAQFIRRSDGRPRSIEEIRVHDMEVTWRNEWATCEPLNSLGFRSTFFPSCSSWELLKKTGERERLMDVGYTSFRLRSDARTLSNRINFDPCSHQQRRTSSKKKNRNKSRKFRAACTYFVPVLSPNAPQHSLQWALFFAARRLCIFQGRSEEWRNRESNKIG